jgi:hypothetical protein
VVDADVDPAAVAGEVLDPVRDGLLDVWTGEEAVVVFDLDGLAGGAPLPTSQGSRPSCSRFLASTLMTGSPAAWWSLTCSLRWRNWASRSGCWAPSRVLTLACRLNPSRFNSRPTVGAETGCPCRVSSSARCRSDLVVHRSGDIGSPRRSGSTSASRLGGARGALLHLLRASLE